MQSLLRRPLQIWIGYLLCLAVVSCGMVWLTVKAVELDRARNVALAQTDAARLEAERAKRNTQLYDLVSSALWRMDTVLTPLVAQEATRPYLVYQPFLAKPRGKGSSKDTSHLIPSPLLQPPNEFISVHFEVCEPNSWTSPQFPTGTACQVAIDNGVSHDEISRSGQRIDELKDVVDYNQLLACLPVENLPDEDSQTSSGNLPRGINGNGFPQTAVQSRDFANDRLQQLQRENGQQEVTNVRQQRAQLSQQARQQGMGGGGRGGREWQSRNQSFNNFAENTLRGNRVPALDWGLSSDGVREGITRPLWLGSKLLLARRVNLKGSSIIQGCWVDWPRLKTQLLLEVSDLLTGIDLVPIHSDDEVQPGTALATLPVQVVVVDEDQALGLGPLEPVVPRSSGWGSPIRISLVFAWTCLFTAACAIAVLLQGVVKLSERRGAFVSAVTHELRTPLTTFRMYAEMLVEEMVPSPQQRKQYLETLRVEADRLTHLVENVLAYSRLERDRKKPLAQRVTVQELTDRVEKRLSARADQSEMGLVIQLDGDLGKRTLRTDVSAIEQVLFNLVENACKYAVMAEDRRIHLEFSADRQRLRISVRDHGPGIDPADAKRLFRPFSKSVQQAAESAPGVGLGLALCQRLVSALKGTLKLDPTQGEGARFVITLPLDPKTSK